MKTKNQNKQKKFLAVLFALLIAVGVPAVLYQGLLAEIQLYVLVDLPVVRAKAPQIVNLSVKERVYGLLIENGLNFDEAITAMAIIGCESKFDQWAIGVNNGSLDLGLAKINMRFHKEVSRACAFDLECAVKEMVRIYRANKSWSAWVCYSKI